MAAGSWVFPLTIVAFFVFLVGYVASHPALPVEAGSRERIGPGSVVELDYVQYYDLENRYAARTSNQELYRSGALNEPPQGLILTRPIALEIPEDAPITDPVIQALLGKRAGDVVETEPVHGVDWQETRDVSLTVAEFPAVETLRDGQNFSTQRGNIAFDLEQALDAWAREEGRTVGVGDVVNCEPGAPWECEIVALDRGAGTITYRRSLVEGQTIPAQPILRFWPQTPVPDARILPMEQDESIALVWQVKPGDAFIIAQAAGDWDAGAYEVQSVTDGSARVSYLAGADVLAHLVGEDFWFELTILSVEPHEDDHAH